MVMIIKTSVIIKQQILPVKLTMRGYLPWKPRYTLTTPSNNCNLQIN